MRYIIAGAGSNGKILYNFLKRDNTVLFFVDNNESLYGKIIDGIRVEPIDSCKNESFDKIVISQYEPQIYEEVYKQLLTVIDKKKIVVCWASSEFIEAFSDQRTDFIKDFARYARGNIEGSVAECGVYRGDSAKYINRYFYDRKLYLFDTFEGFGKDDLEYEITAPFSFDSEYFDDLVFRDTSVELVLRKMSHVNNVIVRKGLFPKTAEGINDKFCFVNLDMDLYQPMLAGISFFYKQMAKGGCLLLHDYFHKGLGGVKKAVEDYETANNISFSKVPIGDECSIAIIKN